MAKKPNPGITNIEKIKRFLPKKNFIIKEVVKEPTAGGLVFRRVEGTIEILLIQDAKNRWTIPKGHIEPGETAKQTAEREIQEETGLQKMTILNHLGKISFRYRRVSSLVLMTTEIFLVRAEGDTSDVKPEEWMNGIKWFKANDALEKIEYEDICKLLLIALKKIRDQKL